MSSAATYLRKVGKLRPPHVPDRFGEIIRTVDWFSPNALDEVRRRCDQLIEEAPYYWRKRGRSLRLPFDALVRNIVVCSAPEERPALRLILERLSEKAGWEWLSGLREAFSQLPPGDGDYALVRRIVLERRPPSRRLFSGAPSLPQSALPACLLMHVRRPARMTARTLETQLAGVPRRAWSALARRKEGASRLWRGACLPRITRRVFERLPLSFRRAVLRDRDRAAVLHPIFLAQIESDPFGYHDTPELLDLRRSGLRAIRERQFQRDEFWAYIDQGPLRADRMAILRAVRAGKGTESARCTEAPPEALTERRHARIGRAGLSPLLLLMLRAGNARKLLEQGLSEGPSRVLKWLSDEDLKRLLAAARSPNQTARILGWVGGSDQALRVVRLAKENHLDHLLQQAPALIPRLSGSLHRGHLRKEILCRCLLVEDPREFRRLLRRGPNRAEKALLADAVAAGARPAMGPEECVGLLDQQLRAAFGKGEYSRFVQLLEARAKIDARSRIKGLRAPRDPQGLLAQLDEAPAGARRRALMDISWKAAPKRSDESGAAWQPADALLEASPGELCVLARAFPAQFADAAARTVPVEQLLPIAARYGAVARALDRRLSKEERRALILHAVELAGTPAERAAYEVALAFSLSDLPYLRALSRRYGRKALRTASKERRGRLFDDLYRTYELPKRSGGKRTITVPEDPLRRLQRRIALSGFREIPLMESAHGFRPGCSILTNALPHASQPIVLNLDIAECFPRTTYRQIVRVCRMLLGGNLSPAAVMLVADLCSFRGALPTGAPSSPDILNIVLTSADRAIGAVCRRKGWGYTRYADDLTVSGSGDVVRIIPFIAKVLGDYGYRIHRDKTNIFRKGRRQMVTGLVVNERPNLPRQIRRRLRAAVHRKAHGGQPTWEGHPVDDAELRGRLAILQMCSPEEARPHLETLGWARGMGDS